MKRFISAVLATIIVLSIMSSCFINSSAATYFEKESNNSYSSADLISVGNSITGEISNYNDDDYYKIVPSSNGKLSISFKHKHSSPNSWWYINTYYYCDGKYNQLNTTYVYLHSDENIKLLDIGAVANGVYYVVVSQASGTEVYGYDYTISTSFSSSNYYERELNDTFQSSTSMSSGNKYTGYLYSMYDKDYYKITASSNSNINLTFNHIYNSANSWWRIKIYNYSNGSYDELSTSYVYLHSSENFSLPTIKANSGSTYYVLVEFASGTPIIGYEYSISIGSSSSSTTSSLALSLSSTSISLNKGSSATVNCTYSGTHPNAWTLYFSINDDSIVSASWGNWNGKTAPLSINGKKAGTTTIKILIKDKITEAEILKKNISVTVIDNTPNLTIQNTSFTIDKNETHTVKCSVTGKNGSNGMRLNFDIEGYEDIISVAWKGGWDNGGTLEIKGLKDGTATVKVWLEDKTTGEVLDSGSFRVIVEDPSANNSDFNIFTFLFSWILVLIKIIGSIF